MAGLVPAMTEKIVISEYNGEITRCFSTPPKSR